MCQTAIANATGAGMSPRTCSESENYREVNFSSVARLPVQIPACVSSAACLPPFLSLPAVTLELFPLR